MYGVSSALEETMDVAAKLAIAAVLEAMKNAGLLKGVSTLVDEWKLEEKYRDTTGIRSYVISQKLNSWSCQQSKISF